MAHHQTVVPEKFQTPRHRCATKEDCRLADCQVNEENLLWNALTDSLFLILSHLKVYFRDRESVRAFYNNVYLVYLPLRSLRLSHTGI